MGDPRCSLSRLAAAAAIFFAFFATTTLAQPHLGEAQTSWRAGDAVRYRYACPTAALMLELVQNNPNIQQFFEYASKGKCIYLPFWVPTVLKKFIAGPFDVQTNTPASVWETVEGMFAWIDDAGGPHQSIRLQSL